MDANLQFLLSRLFSQKPAENGKHCQYCGSPSGHSHTCKTCKDGWPTDACRCVNNGDYCEACAAWIDERHELRFREAEDDYDPHDAQVEAELIEDRKAEIENERRND